MRREIFYSNERHEEDGAGKQRVNGGLHPEQKQSNVERERVGQQWAYAGTTWDSHQCCAKKWLGIASANFRRRLVKTVNFNMTCRLLDHVTHTPTTYHQPLTMKVSSSLTYLITESALRLLYGFAHSYLTCGGGGCFRISLMCDRTKPSS